MSIGLNLPVLLDDMPWARRAACRHADPDVFFPGRGRDARAARKICADCPVADECLTWALDHDEFGVWGGTTDHERRAMRRASA